MSSFSFYTFTKFAHPLPVFVGSIPDEQLLTWLDVSLSLDSLKWIELRHVRVTVGMDLAGMIKEGETASEVVGYLCVDKQVFFVGRLGRIGLQHIQCDDGRASHIPLGDRSSSNAFEALHYGAFLDQAGGVNTQASLIAYLTDSIASTRWDVIVSYVFSPLPRIQSLWSPHPSDISLQEIGLAAGIVSLLESSPLHPPPHIILVQSLLLLPLLPHHSSLTRLRHFFRFETRLGERERFIKKDREN